MKRVHGEPRTGQLGQGWGPACTPPHPDPVQEAEARGGDVNGRPETGPDAHPGVPTTAYSCIPLAPGRMDIFLWFVTHSFIHSTSSEHAHGGPGMHGVRSSKGTRRG